MNCTGFLVEPAGCIFICSGMNAFNEVTEDLGLNFLVGSDYVAHGIKQVVYLVTNNLSQFLIPQRQRENERMGSIRDNTPVLFIRNMSPAKFSFRVFKRDMHL